MKKLSLLSFGLLLAAVMSSTSALADTLFNFSFSSPSGPSASLFSGSGQFTTTLVSAGVYRITGVTGTVNEGSHVGDGDIEAITSLFAVNAYNHNDNLLYFPISGNNYKAFDQYGVAFELADGSDVRLYNNNGENLSENDCNGNSIFQQRSTITITPVTSPVPEPGSLALLGTGVLGFAGMVRRRFAA